MSPVHIQQMQIDQEILYIHYATGTSPAPIFATAAVYTNVFCHATDPSCQHDGTKNYCVFGSIFFFGPRVDDPWALELLAVVYTAGRFLEKHPRSHVSIWPTSLNE